MPTTDDRPACHENLECLLSGSRGQLLHAIATDAVAHPLYRASLPPGRLVPYEVRRRLRPFLNDDAVLRHSDLGPALHAAGATAFLPSYRSSPLLERWTRASGLELLSPRRALQRRLEDKIRFHRLALRHGLPVPAGGVVTAAAQIAALPRGPLVCQLPASEGMEGTFLVRSRGELRAELTRGALALPLLCRQLVRGPALGITIVVGARELLLSAVRYQCRGLRRREADLAGVQFVARDALAPAARERIAEVMTATGQALREAGFLGAANVDFVLAGERVLLIECNPRFASSTPLVALAPALLHGLDLITEHFRALRGEALGAHRPRLPRSSFQGAYVDLGDRAAAIMRAARRRVVREMPEPGVYALAGQRLRLVSQDVAELRGAHRLLFHYSTPAGQRLGARADLGSVLTRFPLFSFRRGAAALAPRGAALLRQLLERMRLAGPDRSLAELARRVPLGRVPLGPGPLGRVPLGPGPLGPGPARGRPPAARGG